ncbi:MAG: hypothetical protein H6Q67_734 [Firmicutes bacterium]|nr:hypothetical protein [Bacillota bacterium]
MDIFLLLLIYTGVALFQVPALIKKSYWRELIAFSSLFTLAFTLNLLQILDVNIPNPLKGIQYIVEDVLHLKY